jgi:hypothetical protein
MAIHGLKEFRLTAAGLERLGARRVTFSVQLTGLPLRKLKPLSPRRRDATLRATLKQQLAGLKRRFPEADLTSRNTKGSWTLDGSLPASGVRQLAERSEVSDLSIKTIDGRSSARPTKAKGGWFCVWGVVAIQVEGQRSGTLTVEDRFVLVRAFDAENAVDQLAPEWREYGKPYLNPEGYMVRWHLVEIKDVFGLHDDRLSPAGTEVYSRLRTAKLKPEYRWLPGTAATKRRSGRP